MDSTFKVVLKLLLKVIGLYLLWFVLYDLVLRPTGVADKWLINLIVKQSSFILQMLGYILIPEPPVYEVIRTIGIDGTHGLWIGDPCNGLTIMALFCGFIIVLPGNWKYKIVFCILGIFIIHISNVVRIAILCIILKYYPNALEFNHTYTFTFVVYIIVFLLWWIWVSRVMKKNKNK